MILEELAFLALASIAVATAIASLLVRELVHTILWIAMFFVDLSALYFLLEAPFLGEHNQRILSSYLGYTPERIARLEQEGVLRSLPR